MTDKLDQVLASEPSVSPSGDFASRVMRAVRRSVDQLAPLTFPWVGLAAGFAGAIVCTLITIVLLPGSGLTQSAIDATAWIQGLPQGMDPGLAAMIVALVVSLAVVRLSVAYTGE